MAFDISYNNFPTAVCVKLLLRVRYILAALIKRILFYDNFITFSVLVYKSCAHIATIEINKKKKKINCHTVRYYVADRRNKFLELH